jgi:hypothetical protein
MRMRDGRRRSEVPSQFAREHSWKYGESRLGCEWLAAAGGHASIRRSVGWVERGFGGGRRISSGSFS